MKGEARVQTIQTAQVILSALMVGVIGLTVAAIFVHPHENDPDPELGERLLVVLAGVAVLELPVYGLMRKRAIRKLARRYQNARAEVRHDQIPPELLFVTLLGAGMVEGLGIFGAVIFYLTNEWLALAAPAAAIILIGMLIPGKESIERAVRLSREQA